MLFVLNQKKTKWRQMRVFQKKQVSNIKRGRSQPVIYTHRVWTYKQRQTDRIKVLKKAFKLNLTGKRSTHDKMVQPRI
jgi:hypothetical protein